MNVPYNAENIKVHQQKKINLSLQHTIPGVQNHIGNLYLITATLSQQRLPEF